ncbi:DUF4192 domain-containing protein [Dietzia sp. DQ11-38-2]|uniref:DUF4192 domain-containing protein n=2 Tax=unclassified Dietzia TaxID=2617939 RepID=UPI0015FB69D3|nr:DUF4192 domain-containing protein [Dietzia sp. DQ11-38-2]MBB1026602.1 DUF4192 domain-containing protein [Dietzia sp. DQ11-38-2]
MTGNGRIGGDGMDGTPTVVITSPEELIASIPSMLGFPPGTGSVVIVCGRTAGGRAGPVVRMDVDGLLGSDRDELSVRDEFPPMTVDDGPARGLARFCAREGVTGVHLVVVHEDCADGETAGLLAEDVAAAFEYWLGLSGTQVVGAYGVGEFAHGSPWVDLFGMVRGTQVDPDSTEIAAVHAFDGRIRAGSRDEIEDLYLERDDDACDDDPHGSGPVRLGGSHEVDRAVQAHEDAVRSLEVGEELDEDVLAGIGRALLDIAVRDEVYRRLAQRGLGDQDGRRLLWWLLARRRPGRERSVALLLLGAAAYFAGGGVHARAALEAAVSADPANSLARLLLHGLEQGLAPERLRRVAAA